ncbi:hypothetical protein CPB84DRAFT_1769745 [Gymnopilus junonius]|uniref:Uncharacterized protein n=1 Tax=Gymnopilus junonius TaxID=109634 RepID=A0A9P5NVL1_GYMJU|nr:hypothetical protein CPB84DRAFT_1769745 [Gymnopilus junonius]
MASQDDSSLAPPAPPSYSRHPFLTETGIKGQRVLWLDGNGGWGIYDTRELHTLPGITWEKTMEDWAKKVRQSSRQTSKSLPMSASILSCGRSILTRNQQQRCGRSWTGSRLSICTCPQGSESGPPIAPLGFLKHQVLRKWWSRIMSLSLELCYMHNLVLPHATRLKDLHIIENNACDIFCHAVDSKRNSGLAKQLEVLEIRTKNGHDLESIYTPRGFRRRLKKCTNLREFTFAAGMKNGLDVRLTEYISNSVEELTLEFSRSLPFLRESYEWVESAADSTWLPRLKSFKMTVDPKSYFGDMMIMRVRNSPQERVEVDLPMDFTPKRFNQEFD